MMAADTVLTRELMALKDELSTARGERASPPAHPPAAEAASAEPGEAEVPAEDRHIAEQLRDLIDTIKAFADDAERNVAEHPAASLVGALLLGIVIGRLIGKR
jgi:ElaB/YqjD/DUF883 family membrane-anchored ribosome-binding protein